MENQNTLIALGLLGTASFNLVVVTISMAAGLSLLEALGVLYITTTLLDLGVVMFKGGMKGFNNPPMKGK